MGYRWKPSKSKAREFAAKMDEIREFCDANGIYYSANMDSYYFTMRGEKYRVSNHTVEASNRGAYNALGEQVREKYHTAGEYNREHEITAGKTRIIEIYNALQEGRTLDKRGNVTA